MHPTDFPTWLSYGGLACCLLVAGIVIFYKLRHKRQTPPPAAMANVHPPRRQPGKPAPFVYNAAIPWGWLEYRKGNFLGQELALKRAIISVGREADNEIELDDDTISRYHAELAWLNGQVYVTDNQSLNGVLLNGQRIRTSLLVKHGDLLDIGAHHFLLKIAHAPTALDEMDDDPLLKHVRKPTAQKNTPLPSLENQPPAGPTRALQHFPHEQPRTLAYDILDLAQPATSLLAWQKAPSEQAPSLCILRSGALAGRSFLLDRPQLTVGRGSTCDIVIDDASLATCHAQFSHQAAGDYIQALANQHSSQVNGESLYAPRLLHRGDIIALGNVHLEYMLVPDAQTTHLPFTPIEPSPLNLPNVLRLPSRLIE